MDYTSAGRQFDYITPLLAAGLSMKQTAMGLLLVTTTRANLLVWHRYTLMWEKDQQKPKVIEAMRFTCLSSTRLSHFYSGWDFCHNAPHTSHVMYTWTDFLKMLWSLFDRAPMYWLTSHRITCWMWRMKRPSWRIQSQSRKLEVRKVKLASSLLAIHPCTPRLGVGLRMSQLCTISTEHDAMTESMMSWSSLTLNYGQDSFPEVYDHCPKLRETDWQIIDVNGAYFTDHPTELNSVVKFVYVPVDFQPMPGHVGVVILYSFMHTSTRAYPLPSPITTERLWQWARVQAQCRAGSSWSCSAYVNGERLLEHEARILHHGDYLRMQIEETRDRGPRGELLTIGADDQAFKRAQSAIDGHDKWPMTSATPDDVMLPVPSRAPSSARQEDHADYWIAMAWSMQLAAGWVLQRHMRQYPMTRQQRHAKKVQRRKAPLRRAYVFLYLIMAGPISDALLYQHDYRCAP